MLLKQHLLHLLHHHQAAKQRAKGGKGGNKGKKLGDSELEEEKKPSFEGLSQLEGNSAFIIDSDDAF